MSRYTKYDFCPEESDSAILRNMVEQMVLDMIGTKPEPQPAPKPKDKQLSKGKVSPRLMLSQEHMAKGGRTICSHLLAVPKGEVPSDNLDMKHVFNQHPFDEEAVREGWNLIHDRSLKAQYPLHDIYWLCSADWLSELVVKAVVEAAYKVEKAAPIATTPVRKVTNEIVLG